MTRQGKCAAIAMLVALGIACGTSQQTKATSPHVAGTDISSATMAPQVVTVDVLGATITPGKADGRRWDGLPGQPSRDLLRANTALAAMSAPYALAVSMLTELANTGCDPPDVNGMASLFVGGIEAAPPWYLPKIQDSFTPRWDPGARWSHVLLDDRVRIRLSLVDEDIAEDDPVGVIELNAHHLRAALASGGVYQVRVSDQEPQILFVGVSVMRE